MIDRIFSLDVMPFLVLVFPLAGFTVLALLGDLINRDKEQKGAMLLACATVLLSFGAALWTALHLGDAAALLEQSRTALGLESRAAPYAPYQPGLTFDFIKVAGLHVPIALLVDQLTVVMLLVVTGVGSLIHIYSVGYMAHDEERVRYFSYLNLFTFFMLLLVMGASLPLMFIGWEGVGLCSYLLIGFWYKKKSASDAGMKAFLVNRVGDAGLILGMIVAFHAFGTVNLFDLAHGAGSLAPEGRLMFGPATLVALLLFVGACGKSAQIPLHVWLPDAMEGPTPVSALIHAATMVTAGVYMVARLGALYSVSETAMTVVAVVGTLTAFVAGTIAIVQTDIKRVLAYSTVSQLGYMFLACGVGAFGYGVFHLYTHAFFKALLFLGSGSVIHALSGEQDMRKMGGLWAKLPWTFATFAVGTAAIAGLPLLSGFYSKDGILEAALEHHHPGLFAVGLLTAVMTAFYMGRLLFLTFLGPFRVGHEAERHGSESPWALPALVVMLALGSIFARYVPFLYFHFIPTGTVGMIAMFAYLVRLLFLTHSAPFRGGHEAEHHIHESPWSMLGPLVILAAGAIFAGYARVPDFVRPALQLTATEEHGGARAAWWLPGVATLGAVGGLALAWFLYVKAADLPARIRTALLGVARVLEEKYGFDLAYNWFARRLVVDGSAALLWKRFDAGLIDGAVNGSGRVVTAFSRAARGLQGGLVRGYALLMLGGAVALLYYLLWVRPA